MTHRAHEFCKANSSIHEIGRINEMDGYHHRIRIGQLDLRRYHIFRCHRNPIATIWGYHQPNLVTLFWWHSDIGDIVILVTVILVTSGYWWQWYWWHRDIGDSDIGDSDIGDIVILVTQWYRCHLSYYLPSCHDPHKNRMADRLLIESVWA